MHKHDIILQRILSGSGSSFVKTVDSKSPSLERAIARGVAIADVGEITGNFGHIGPPGKRGGAVEDGGPGSGNFGHKGRPGQRGGSGAGGGGSGGVKQKTEGSEEPVSSGRFKSMRASANHKVLTSYNQKMSKQC